jgi:hypothetical protein
MLNVRAIKHISYFSAEKNRDRRTGDLGHPKYIMDSPSLMWCLGQETKVIGKSNTPASSEPKLSVETLSRILTIFRYLVSLFINKDRQSDSSRTTLILPDFSFQSRCNADNIRIESYVAVSSI